MAISSPGIGSNLDVSGIVSKLMQVESQPLTRLATKEAGIQAKLSAYGTLRSSLSSFQTAVTALSCPSKFQAISVASSDTAIATASAASTAVPGKYVVNVTQLAQAQTVSTIGLASSTAAIGDGTKATINFQFGTISGGSLANGIYTGAAFTQDPTQASASITIDSSNNSLQGIRDAINKAGLGITATIVSDGSATPNHLVLTSNKTGVTSSMKVTVSGNADIAGLMAYDPANAAGQKLKQSNAAQSTQLTVNGVAVSSPTDTVNDAIQGVTLNVSKVGSSTVTLSRDTAAVQTAINGFVKAYNDLNKTVTNLTAYDSSTKNGGLLLGDAATRQIQTQIRSLVSSASGSISGNFTALSQAGISIQKDGTMSLDTAKLQKAMNEGLNDIASLFSTMGTTTDSLVSFSGSTSASMPGKNAVAVSALATQGKVTGSAPAGLTITAGSNDELVVTVDGKTATVKMLAGTYTAAALAAHVQSTVNGATEFNDAGIKVDVSNDAGGVLTITSSRYGSASSVAVSGKGMETLLGAVPVLKTGTDVAGSIGGSLATGSGQFLTGASGSTADGIKLQILGGGTGNRGSVSFSHGFAHSINKLIEGYLGPSGAISARTNGLNSTVKDIAKSRDALNVRLAATEKRYLAQFQALDAVISNMNQTSAYLTQQLAQISNMSKNS